ncbi:MAG: hypothetical protein EXS08_16740 [Planctomycetes bacterium]|nr:hypothetical protein [Planctomycetota bacterium]
MHPKICRSCAALWALGLVGMWVARSVLELEIEATPFRIATSFWILGGLGYAGFGLLAFTAKSR